MSVYSAVVKVVNNVTAPMQQMTNSMNKFKRGVQSTQGAINGLTGAISGLAIIGTVKMLSDAFDEQAQSNLKLSQSVWTYGQKLGMTQTEIDKVYNGIQKFAGEMQDSGIFGDEAIQDSVSFAMSLGYTADQSKNLTKATGDLLAKQKGAKATNEDLMSTNKALAGAIEKGNLKAFQKMGIAMDGMDSKTFKAMSTSERYNFVLNKMKEVSEGAEKAVRMNTVGGRLDGIKNNIGDITQEIARLVLGFDDFGDAPPAILVTIDDLLVDIKNTLAECKSPIEAVNVLFKKFEKTNPIITNLVVSIGTLIGVIATLSAVTNVCQGVFGLFASNPIIAILGLIIALCVQLYLHWDDVKEIVSEVWGTIKSFADYLISAFVSAWNTVKSVVLNVVDSLYNAFAKLFNNHPIIQFVNAVAGLAGSDFTLHIDERKSDTNTHNATGTSYFKGGLTHINENNRGEVVNLPSGTQIIPHDVAVKQNQGSTYNVSVNIQGNVIGDEEYANSIGDTIVTKLQLAMNNM